MLQVFTYDVSASFIFALKATISCNFGAGTSQPGHRHTTSTTTKPKSSPQGRGLASHRTHETGFIVSLRTIAILTASCSHIHDAS